MSTLLLSIFPLYWPFQRLFNSLDVNKNRKLSAERLKIGVYHSFFFSNCLVYNHFSVNLLNTLLNLRSVVNFYLCSMNHTSVLERNTFLIYNDNFFT